MTEYAYCPGYQFREDLERPQCENLVKVCDGDAINYCCVNCFETSWTPINDALWNREPEFVDSGHSTQCGVRQYDRKYEVAVIDREFTIMGRVPSGKDVPPVR